MIISRHEDPEGIAIVSTTPEDSELLWTLFAKLIMREGGKPWLGPVVDEVEMSATEFKRRLSL